MERPRIELQRYLPWMGWEDRSVGLKQQLRNIGLNCGLETKSDVWEVVESLVCLVRV